MFTQEDIQRWTNNLRQNPKDAEALYQLAMVGIQSVHNNASPVPYAQGLQYLDKAAELNHPRALAAIGMNYKFGNQGKSQDLQMANQYLKRAADLGDERAINELSRERGTKSAEIMHARNAQDYKNHAEGIFSNRQGLEAAIKEEILPAVVSLDIVNGKKGTGFYQHSEWLVSNAHVFPTATSLESAVVTDSDNRAVDLDVAQSYHRPNNNFTAPDISVVKTKSRAGDNGKCIPPFYQDGSGGYGHTNEILFYVYFSQSTQKFEIKYLGPCVNPGQLPYQFLCENNEIPEKGCSGAPLVGARVITGKDPKWTFEIKGVVYARCSGVNNQKHLVAIPTDADFKQLFKVLMAERNTERKSQMVHAAGIMKNKQEEEKYKQELEEQQWLHQHHCAEYTQGVTNLNIDLPDGLEKLYYGEIIDFKKSFLLKKLQLQMLNGKRISENQYKKFSHSLDNAQELKDNFLDLMRQVAGFGMINLPGDLKKLPSAPYFRIDYEGKSKGTGHYIIKVQDNTGDVFIDGKSASSDFAIVNISSDTLNIDGAKLAELFVKCQDLPREAQLFPPKAEAVSNNNNNHQSQKKKSKK